MRHFRKELVALLNGLAPTGPKVLVERRLVVVIRYTLCGIVPSVTGKHDFGLLREKSDLELLHVKYIILFKYIA